MIHRPLALRHVLPVGGCGMEINSTQGRVGCVLMSTRGRVWPREPLFVVALYSRPDPGEYSRCRPHHRRTIPLHLFVMLIIRRERVLCQMCEMSATRPPSRQQQQ